MARLIHLDAARARRFRSRERGLECAKSEGRLAEANAARHAQILFGWVEQADTWRFRRALLAPEAFTTTYGIPLISLLMAGGSMLCHLQPGPSPADQPRARWVPPRSPMPRDPLRNPDEAITVLPCCNEAYEIEGLALLRRSFPRSWHRILNSTLIPEIERSTTLRRYLGDGAGGLLGAASARDQGLKKKRAAARRVAEHLGQLRVAELSEADLVRVRERYREEFQGERLKELIQVDMRILRQAVHRGQVALGMAPEAPTWGRPGRGKGGGKRQRDKASLHQVRSLLEVSTALLAAAIALIVGCGLLPSEVLALRAIDLNIPGTFVRVLHRGVRGWGDAIAERHVYIPHWAWQFVRRAWPGLARMNPDELLFPSRDDPHRPWQNLNRALRRAAVQAGLQAEGGRDSRWTPTGLRRIYQAIARQVGLPRALVRGTVLGTPPHEGGLENAGRWLVASSHPRSRPWPRQRHKLRSRTQRSHSNDVIGEILSSS